MTYEEKVALLARDLYAEHRHKAAHLAWQTAEQKWAHGKVIGRNTRAGNRSMRAGDRWADIADYLCTHVMGTTT